MSAARAIETRRCAGAVRIVVRARLQTSALSDEAWKADPVEDGDAQNEGGYQAHAGGLPGTAVRNNRNGGAQLVSRE